MTARTPMLPCANCAAPIRGAGNIYCSESCRAIVRLVQDWRIALVYGSADSDPSVRYQLERRLDLAVSGLQSFILEPLTIEAPASDFQGADAKCHSCGLQGRALTCVVDLPGWEPFMIEACDPCLGTVADLLAASLPPEERHGVASRLRARVESEEPTQPSDDPFWRPDLWGPLDLRIWEDETWLLMAEEGYWDDPSPLLKAGGSQFSIAPWVGYRGPFEW